MWDAAWNSSFEMLQAARKEAKGGRTGEGRGVSLSGRGTHREQTYKWRACHWSCQLGWPALAWSGTKWEPEEQQKSRKAKEKPRKSRGKLTNAQRSASWQFFLSSLQANTCPHTCCCMSLHVFACSVHYITPIWGNHLAQHKVNTLSCPALSQCRPSSGRRRCMVTDTCYMPRIPPYLPPSLLCWTQAAKLTTHTHTQPAANIVVIVDVVVVVVVGVLGLAQW